MSGDEVQEVIVNVCEENTAVEHVQVQVRDSSMYVKHISVDVHVVVANVSVS